ncbi:MAG: hypothetical protein BRD57_06230 [Proteobacteria bacterium SW_6_67_9]|nr:MAG: hypothetical protein BRD57_06230 [Proteobacteria bacterium SW_6_67_9]
MMPHNHRPLVISRAATLALMGLGAHAQSEDPASGDAGQAESGEAGQEGNAAPPISGHVSCGAVKTSDNTESESVDGALVSEIESSVTSTLSLRLAHTVQHDADVTDDRDDTDRITTVSVEYGF